LLKFILLTLISFNLFALEISIDSAKENFHDYSIINLKAKNDFMCQEIKDEFGKTKKIVCAFSKKPRKPLKNIQNNFFNLNTIVKDKIFFIVVKPFYKMRLFPIVFDLCKDNSVYKANVKISKHWTIVGFKDTVPLIDNSNADSAGINFPFFLQKDKLPYVGGLDLKGNPVHLKKVEDVSQYLKVKQNYKKKKYDFALELIDDTFKNYPRTLFRSELLYYKLKVYSKLKQYDNVISLSKEYLRDYSANDNVPEILSLVAKAYSKTGLNSDADYFFDRLFTEYPDSIYTKWGYIYKGEMLEDSGNAKKAIKFYKQALMETKNIDVAVNAAYRLAVYNLGYSKIKKASKYIMEIIRAKSSFFMNNLKSSIKNMHQFADADDYITASAMAKALLDNMSSKNDKYEVILKDRGVWLAKTSHKKEALKVLDDYLKKYKYGNYQDIVQTTKDSLFFDIKDKNTSAKLKQFNKLISDYKDDSIGNRAIYEKAKLLLAKKMYSDVLGFKKSILALDSDKYKDKNQIIREAVIGVMKLSLKHKQCQEVLDLSNQYKISLSTNWDDGIYMCAMKGGDYILSKTIANRNLESKNINQRKKWLFRYIKVDYATSNYSDVIDASKELISLIQGNKKSLYKEVYRIIFDAYQRLGKTDQVINYIDTIQKVFGLDYKDIGRYVAVMGIGSKLKDDTMVIKYASDVMKIQKSSNSYNQSPYVEFTLYQAYINKNDLNKALETIKSLNNVKLDESDRARQKYLLGSVYSRLWRNDDAKKAYKDSIKADPKSAWAKLAKDALKV